MDDDSDHELTAELKKQEAMGLFDDVPTADDFINPDEYTEADMAALQEFARGNAETASNGTAGKASDSTPQPKSTTELGASSSASATSTVKRRTFPQPQSRLTRYSSSAKLPKERHYMNPMEMLQRDIRQRTEIGKLAAELRVLRSVYPTIKDLEDHVVTQKYTEQAFRIMELQGIIDDKDYEIRRLNERLATASATEKEVVSLRSKLSDVTNAYEELEEKFATLETKQQLNGGGAQTSDQHSFRSIDTSVASPRALYYKRKVEKIDSDALEREMKLREELLTLRETLDTHEQRVKMETARVDQLEATNSALVADAATHQTALDALKAELTNAELKVQRFSDLLVEMDAESRDAKQEIRQLKAQLKAVTESEGGHQLETIQDCLLRLDQLLRDNDELRRMLLGIVNEERENVGGGETDVDQQRQQQQLRLSQIDRTSELLDEHCRRTQEMRDRLRAQIESNLRENPEAADKFNVTGLSNSMAPIDESFAAAAGARNQQQEHPSHHSVETPLVRASKTASAFALRRKQREMYQQSPLTHSARLVQRIGTTPTRSAAGSRVSFAPGTEGGDTSAMHDASSLVASFANLSLNTTRDVVKLQNDLARVRVAYRAMFDTLRTSADLFEEILAEAGIEDEQCRVLIGRIRTARLNLNKSVLSAADLEAAERTVGSLVTALSEAHSERLSLLSMRLSVAVTSVVQQQQQPIAEEANDSDRLQESGQQQEEQQQQQPCAQCLQWDTDRQEAVMTIQDLCAAKQRLEADLVTAERRELDQHMQLTEARAQLADMDEVRTELQSLQGDLRRHQSELEMLRDQLALTQRQIEMLQTEKCDALRRAAGAENRVAQLEEHARRLGAEHADLQTRLATAERRAKVAEDEQHELNARLVTAHTNVNRLETLLIDAQHQTAAAQRELQSFVAEVAQRDADEQQQRMHQHQHQQQHPIVQHSPPASPTAHSTGASAAVVPIAHLWAEQRDKQQVKDALRTMQKTLDREVTERTALVKSDEQLRTTIRRAARELRRLVGDTSPVTVESAAEAERVLVEAVTKLRVLLLKSIRDLEDMKATLPPTGVATLDERRASTATAAEEIRAVTQRADSNGLLALAHELVQQLKRYNKEPSEADLLVSVIDLARRLRERVAAIADVDQKTRAVSFASERAAEHEQAQKLRMERSTADRVLQQISNIEQAVQKAQRAPVPQVKKTSSRTTSGAKTATASTSEKPSKKTGA